MTHFALKDELLDAQTLRVAGAAPYGGADVGECLRAAAGVRGTDLTSWHTAWTSMAASALSLAESQQATAVCTVPGSLFSVRQVTSALRGSCCWERRWTRALSRATRSRRPLSGPAPPYSSTAGDPQIPIRPRLCPGTSSRGPEDLRGKRGRRHRQGGYNGTAEELYFANGAARWPGVHVLAFDGPVQGAALLQRELVMRPDWRRSSRRRGRPEKRPDVDHQGRPDGPEPGWHLAPGLLVRSTGWPPASRTVVPMTFSPPRCAVCLARCPQT